MPTRDSEDTQEDTNPLLSAAAQECPQCNDLMDGPDEHRAHQQHSAR